MFFLLRAPQAIWRCATPSHAILAVLLLFTFFQSCERSAPTGVQAGHSTATISESVADVVQSTKTNPLPNSRAVTICSGPPPPLLGRLLKTDAGIREIEFRLDRRELYAMGACRFWGLDLPQHSLVVYLTEFDIAPVSDERQAKLRSWIEALGVAPTIKVWSKGRFVLGIGSSVHPSVNEEHLPVSDLEARRAAEARLSKAFLEQIADQ